MENVGGGAGTDKHAAVETAWMWCLTGGTAAHARTGARRVASVVLECAAMLEAYMDESSFVCIGFVLGSY